MTQAIHTPNAPAAVGPYSQAILATNPSQTLYCSGQIPLDPQTGLMVEGGIESQTKQVLDNVQAVLTEAGFNMQDVVKCDVLLADINDFTIVNEIYARFFNSDPKPARATYQVANLPKGALVEIACIAVK